MAEELTPDGVARPTVGRIVHYRSRTGNYTLPAVVTCTSESLYDPGVARGDLPPLTNELSIHLHVMTPGEKVSYQEHDVQFDEDEGPGTWRWPPRV